MSNPTDATCLERARRFAAELIEVTETYGDICDQVGYNALILLMYLQQSLLDETVRGVELCEHYGERSIAGFLEYIDAMESHEEWRTYIHEEE